MKLRQWLLGAAGGAVLGLAATAVQALPAGGMQGELKLATPPLIEKAYVRCGWRYGRRVCWRVIAYPYYAPYPYYYPPYPYYYGYYGPPVGFYWGRGYRRHW